MALIAKKSATSSTFKPVPPGVHLARCYRIVDLGTQKKEWKGQIKNSPQIMLVFEVHSEDDDGNQLVTEKGEPMTISKNYTNIISENSNLAKDLVLWRGRPFTEKEFAGFNLTNVLGAWCMIATIKTLGKDGNEYTNIQSIMPVPAGTKKLGLPEGHNPAKAFDLSAPDWELFDTFSKKLQEKILASPEGDAAYNTRYAKEQVESANSGTAFDDMDNDVPF